MYDVIPTKLEHVFIKLLNFLYLQFNPDFSNSEGTDEIVRKLESSKNRSIQIKESNQLKNSKYTYIAPLFHHNYSSVTLVK